MVLPRLGGACGGAPPHSTLSWPQAGKFSIIPTIINVGSGVALMGVVSPPPPPRGAPEPGRAVQIGVKRAVWGFTPHQGPPTGSDCLGFSWQSQRLLPVALWLGVLWDPGQLCLHNC